MLKLTLVLYAVISSPDNNLIGIRQARKVAPRSELIPCYSQAFPLPDKGTFPRGYTENHPVGHSKHADSYCTTGKAVLSDLMCNFATAKLKIALGLEVYP